jgi:hypothetical protein
VLLANNGDHNLIELPNITSPRPFTLEAAGVVWPELQGPPATSLLRDEDTTLEQHLLDQSQAQRDSEIEPNRVSDDLGWKAMTFAANELGHTSLSTKLAFTPELT